MICQQFGCEQPLNSGDRTVCQWLNQQDWLTLRLLHARLSVPLAQPIALCHRHLIPNVSRAIRDAWERCGMFGGPW